MNGSGNGSSRDRYELGLSLSGAISAGAYSAGVLDFLLQALDEWQSAATDPSVGDPSVPAHAVGLKVMSGASAGAITAAIAALAMAGDPRREAFPGSPEGQKWKYWFRTLYESWVVSPALVGEPGRTDLLALDDLAGAAVPGSVLNSALLTQIAQAALRVPAPAAMPRRYVSNRLHIYLTLSNLRGVPYTLKFTGGSYHMLSHGDRSHFVVEGLGTWTSPSQFADSDTPTTTLPASDLFATPRLPAWNAYGDAALASAAFPIGLAPRVVNTSMGAYTGRNWPMPNWIYANRAAPSFPPDWAAAHAAGFSYGAVDGGLTNNDPFEYALYTVMDPTREKSALSEADRGVIMIAPFPEPPAFPPDGKPALDLISVYLALMPLLQQQVRFKPEALALAADDAVGSRFMISPSRTFNLPDGKEWDSPYPIASGLLGGFGGFVARSFRDHDFQLGRRNCQRFLQTTFLLPQTNAIIRDGYQAVADQTPFIAADRPGLPIIPLLGSARAQVMPPDWPRITGRDLDTLLGRLSTRLTAVAKALLMRQSISMVFNFFVPLVYFFRGRAKRAIERIILADLVKRDQIAGWTIPAAWGPSDAAGTLEYPVAVRAVIATLIVPGLKLRSEADIVAACQLKPEMVRDILARCIAARGQPYAVCEWADRNGARRVCLRTYQPGWLTRHLGWDHGHAKFFPK